MLERIIEIACLAPSGLGSASPGVVIVRDPGRRQSGDGYFGPVTLMRSVIHWRFFDRYAALKLAGLREAPCHLACSPTGQPVVGLWTRPAYDARDGGTTPQ